MSTSPRPTRMPRSERREQLLRAAQAVFVQQGYHAAAMDEIAERAGVSKPVLYQHFPGKLELYLALLDIHCNALVELVFEGLEAGRGNNEKRVANTVEAYFAFVGHEDAGFRIVFESDLTSDPHVRARLDSAELAVAEAVAGVIAEDTGMDDQTALLLASSVAGMAQVAARRWLAEDRVIPAEVAAQLTSTLIWRGLGALPLLEDEDSATG